MDGIIWDVFRHGTRPQRSKAAVLHRTGVRAGRKLSARLWPVPVIFSCGSCFSWFNFLTTEVAEDAETKLSLAVLSGSFRSWEFGPFVLTESHSSRSPFPRPLRPGYNAGSKVPSRWISNCTTRKLQ